MALFLMFLGILSSDSAEGISLHDVRLLYEKSATDDSSCEKLMHLLENYDEANNPTLAGYRASATMMMANYVFNPFTKLSYFNKGKKLLEKCIEADPDNIELRYLRYTIQCNAPRFLGYNESISSDKDFLLNGFSYLKAAQLKEMIISYLNTSDQLSLAEKQKLNP